jgi:hypothetical protein
MLERFLWRNFEIPYDNVVVTQFIIVGVILLTAIGAVAMDLWRRTPRGWLHYFGLGAMCAGVVATIVGIAMTSV